MPAKKKGGKGKQQNKPKSQEETKAKESNGETLEQEQEATASATETPVVVQDPNQPKRLKNYKPPATTTTGITFSLRDYTEEGIRKEGTEKIQKEDGPKCKKIRALLDHLIRVTITDGRQFTGRLQCLDKQKNVILSECTETSTRVIKLAAGNKEEPSSRFLGTALIPGVHITKYELNPNPMTAMTAGPIKGSYGTAAEEPAGEEAEASNEQQADASKA
eukprot:TRINITY_DN95630_c0_g1_i1.p1 TRINITY_DN95630_c0_g1~~TRINITY_DN95630_c0_g1_i1.p1  ORF type:complete len:219 (+),score=38.20 TRINITY_DN95630_c0_g1_i1:144-800(+)